jgi:hypothetical protein
MIMQISFTISICENKRHTKVALVLLTIHYKQLKIEGIIMAAQLNVNEMLVGTLGLIDHATQQPIPATFGNVSVSSSDTSIFTTNLDNNGNVDVDGIAVGTGTLTISADATYTDPATQATVTFTKILTVSVTVSPANTPTDLVISFGTPQPIPAGGTAATTAA